MTLANHHRLPVLHLARWQRAAPVMPSRAGWGAYPLGTRLSRRLACGPCCRNSRAHDPARGTPL